MTGADNPSPGRHPGFGLDVTTIGGRSITVRTSYCFEKSFCRLVHFERETQCADPAVLVVAPLSGHFAMLLRDMLAALMPEHDLYLMDWVDAREVSVDEGDFGMEDDIAYIIECVGQLNGDVHLIGMCQSAMPALAATALLASRGGSVPRTLTLFGGMIDPRINPTRIDRLTANLSLSWAEYAMATVPPPYPGEGRRVYPASAQQAALIAYLIRHFASGGELLRKLLEDDGEDVKHYPFLRLYLSVMDLPAQFFLDTIRLVFHDVALPLGRLSWRGIAVEPASVTRTALMTVEGEFDDISGLGQTRVAHELCRNIPDHRRRHHLQAGVGHFGLFHGSVWRTAIMPRVRAFIREMA
ncbi:MAG TPA: polyhydroxyalkanoate depolymerase [Stellaceae bacterium]|nr:polyhydroxyalkanoate depolymerase [Stellaceae bacterium]